MANENFTQKNDWLDLYNQLVQKQEELAGDIWKLQEKYYQLQQLMTQIDSVFQPYEQYESYDRYYSKE